jgi:hypothetical protein
MKIRAIVPVLAVLALAGCGTAHALPPGQPPATRAAVSPSATAVALTCKQQGTQWKAANKSAIREFKDTLTPFTKGTVSSAQAKALSSAARAMLDAPLPACADPKGYYGQAMANLVTAGAAASGGGALSELGALAPMENASTLLTELSAELRQTTGSAKI